MYIEYINSLHDLDGLVNEYYRFRGKKEKILRKFRTVGGDLVGGVEGISKSF